MDHAMPVRAIKRVGNLDRVAEHLFGRQRSAREPRGQRLAFEVLHDEEGDAVLLADIVQDADVRMVQRRDGARFAIEALLRDARDRPDTRPAGSERDLSQRTSCSRDRSSTLASGWRRHR